MRLQLLLGSVLLLGLGVIWVEALWAPLAIEAAVLFLAAWRIAVDGIPWSGATLVALACAGMTVVGILQLAAGHTASPDQTLRGVLYWTTLSGVALLSGNHTARLFRIFAAGAAIMAVAATLQHFTSNGRYFWIWPSGQPDVFGPFQSRNNFASFVLLFLPVALAEGLRRRGQWGWLAASAAMLGAVIVSGSRAGAALVALELLVAVAVYADRRRGAALLLCAGTVLLVLGWDTLAIKLGDSNPLRYRSDIMRSAADLALTRPALGYGLGAFSTVYPAFARFDSGHFVNFAHNDWLEFAADAGLMGAALPLLAAFLIWRRRSVPAALGLAAVCLHATVDYPFQRLGLMGWVIWMAAMVAHQPQGGPKRS